MSGKVHKRLRKEAKQRLLEQSYMNPQQQPKQQLNILAELDQLVFSLELLTGEKPTAISITEPMYNAYVQVAQNNAEALGLNPGFKDDKVTFKGVAIEKKASIVMPTPQNTPDLSTPPQPKTN